MADEVFKLKLKEFVKCLGCEENIPEGLAWKSAKGYLHFGDNCMSLYTMRSRQPTFANAVRLEYEKPQ